MTKMSTMPRLTKLVAGAVVALIGLIALSASAFAQPAPPHQFYGGGLAAGDEVGLGDASATVDENGEWYIRTSAEGVDENSFSVNGQAASATLTSVSDSLTQVTLTVAMMEDDSMMGEDGEMMGEDGEMMGEDGEMMGEDEDAMLDEDDSMTEDDSMGEDVGMPSTGSGGLADSSGISAGLIGLLIALGAAAIAGLGLRRVRNRA